jgi:acyl dehydratase
MDGPIKSVSMDAMKNAVGTELGVSGWTLIDQPMVDAFAKLTGDSYFIHVDPERAKRETPFGGTIVHGFLTLSLLANMAYQTSPWVAGTKTGVNYGFNRLRFVAPVPTGSRVRGRFVLKAFEVQPTRWQSTFEVTVEIEGASKPALVADWVSAGLL